MSDLVQLALLEGAVLAVVLVASLVSQLSRHRRRKQQVRRQRQIERNTAAAVQGIRARYDAAARSAIMRAARHRTGGRR